MNSTTYIEFNFDAVVLANGDYPTHALPLAVLKRTPYVVCCDGAANEYLQREGTPDAIVGDGDSLDDAYRQQVSSIFHHVADQETNDQTKAIGFLQEKGFRRIAIVGATGKREDHTLGNISLLIEYMQAGIEVVMLTDYGVFTPANGTHTFHAQAGQQLSIFNYGATGLQSSGLAYPLSDFQQWWQGTLNEATSDKVTIRGTGSYIVYQAY